MAQVDPRIARDVAFDRDVTAEVSKVADQLGAQARGNLAQHRATGAAKIEVQHRVDGSPDSTVSLVDPAALSIEYGRGAYTRRDGHHVGAAEPLAILGRLL